MDRKFFLLITEAGCKFKILRFYGFIFLVFSFFDQLFLFFYLFDTQADLLRRDMRDKFYYAMWNWIRRYWRNIGKAKDIAPQTAAAYERALDKQVEEVADLKYRLSSLTQWRDIQADPKWGFATDDAIDEIFRNLPRLVRDKRDGSIELIDYDNAAEWRGDLERKPSLYQWLPINGNTL